MDFLSTRDPVRRLVILGIAKEVLESMKIRDHNLAVEIANQVGKSFGGK